MYNLTFKSMKLLLAVGFLILSTSCSHAEFNLDGTWKMSRLVIPKTGIQSGEAIKNAKDALGQMIEIKDKSYVFTDVKDCIFDDVHQEVLIDGTFAGSGHMMVDWSELGFKPYSENARGNKLYAVFSYDGYCPNTSDLTEEEKARIDWTKVDEYEGHKFLEDQHVIYVANKGQLVLLDYFDVWVELEKQESEKPSQTQDVVADPENQN